MANSTVSSLPAASALDGTELYYGVQAAADTKVTGTQIKTLVLAGATTTLGGADAASPVAQTLNVQSVVTGTSNTAGTDWTIAGSKGTGTGNGGSILFKVAPSGGSGSSQNTLATAVSIVPGSVVNQLYVGGANISSGQFNGEMAFLPAANNYVQGILYLDPNTSTIHIRSDTAYAFAADTLNYSSSTIDTFITRAAAAAIRFGKADAAAPVAQTLQVQSVVAGTSNTAGADFTIAGSKGTGTGAGGSIVLKTAPAGGSGTSQNALATAVTINSAGHLLVSDAGTAAAPALTIFATTRGFYAANGGVVFTENNGNVAWGSDQTAGFSVWSNAAASRIHFGLGTSDLSDVILSRGGAAIAQWGDIDVAAPVAQTLQVQSVIAGTTDTAGTDWTRIASKGTGTGAGGNLINKTAFSAKSTGTGQGTTVDRHIVVAKGKVLTSAAAFSMFDVALPTLTMCGGVIEATIVCTDGTDMQSFTQTITYSAVNKGGVYTTSITPSTGDKSVSAGTLTTSWTIVSGTNKVTIKVTPTTSLTPSTNSFLLYYTVRNNSEQATTIL